MTVKVSKPAINVREELADLKKPTGIAGQAMLAAETPQEQQALIGVGRRNLILNGDFKISQRGNFTSATAITHDDYYVDRWSVRVTNVTANIQHILGSNASPGYPYKASNSLRLTATNTATGKLRHLQRTEGFLDGQTLTFSAWVKSNSPDARLFQYQNDGQYRVSSKAHSGNGQWEFLSVTAMIKSTSDNQIYNDAAIASSTFGNVSITTGDYIEISEAQLEINKTFTPFEHRSYGEELALCQRYYQANSSTGNNNGFIVVEYANNFRGRYLFPVTMRANPTVTTDFSSATIYDISTSLSASFFGTDNQTTTGFRVNGNTTGVSTVGYINSWGWAADAEL